jgi:flagella basal body P-ring formation protein FlgA
MSAMRWLCLALLPALPLRAQAQDFESAEHIGAVAQAYVASQAGAGVQTFPPKLDPRLRLPACGQALQASASAANARSAWSVAVHCGAPEPWTLYVSIRVADRRSVVVLKRALAPGMPVKADDLALEERDVTSLPYGYVERTADVIGKTLRRPVMVGTPVAPDAVAAPVTVHRGQDVTLISRAGGFEVRAGGRALADAANGERVRAENQDSHRIVEGVVLDGATIEIGMD